MPPNGDWHAKLQQKFQALPPDIQKRIAAARDAALKDPNVQQLKQKADDAGKVFRNAMRDAILKQDPGLADYLKSLVANNGGPKPPGPGPSKFQNPPPPGFANLSDAEKQQLLAARTKAKTDPAVQAAEQQKNAAQTPEQRKSAEEQYHAAMRDAELRIDPSLGPIIEKLHSPAQQTPATQPAQSMQMQGAPAQ